MKSLLTPKLTPVNHRSQFRGRYSRNRLKSGLQIIFARVVFTLATTLALCALGSARADTIFTENFEGAFPGAWSTTPPICYGCPPGGTTIWGVVDSAFGGRGTLSGARKAYCAGRGYLGTTSAPLYQDNMNAYMSRSINLAGYASGTLTFWSRIPSIETRYDFCRVYVDSTVVWQRDTVNTAWTQETIDLTPYVGGTHTLMFKFTSDYSEHYEGWYLDDIALTALLAPPMNDNFANATFLTGVSGSASGTTLAGTKESGEPNHGGNSGGASIWYQWTAPASLRTTFDTLGSGWDTLLAVYTGQSVSGLTLVAQNDDDSIDDTFESRVTFSAKAGATYWIAVDGYGGGSGPVKLNWRQDFTATIITFDDLPAGTTVSGQYHDRGVDFTNTSVGALPRVGQVASGQADSGNQVANISTCSSCGSVTPSAAGVFTIPRQNVRVYVGYFPVPNIQGAADTAVLTLRGFDANHALVAQAEAVVSSGAGLHTMLQIHASSNAISSFEITARSDYDVNKPLGIDSLSFDPIPSLDFEVRVDRVIYRANSTLSALVHLGPGVVTNNLQLVLASPTSGDVEVVPLISTDTPNVYTTMFALPVSLLTSSESAQPMDGIFRAGSNEMFVAMFVPERLPLRPNDPVPNVPDLVADYGVMESPGFAAAPVQVVPQLAMSDDEINVPTGGKRIGTLAIANGPIGQVALDELIIHPRDEAQLQTFLRETEGTIIMDDRLSSNAAPRSYLVRVNSNKADLEHFPQIRALYGEQDLLLASSMDTLKILALATQYRAKGLMVAVNPRMQLMSEPATIDGTFSLFMHQDPDPSHAHPFNAMSSIGQVDAFANDIFGVRRAWAYLALWDRDTQRIPVAFLDQGFAANPDFRGYDPNDQWHDGIFQRDLDNIWSGSVAEGLPCIGASLFGPKVWHGNGVVTTAGGVLNNGWGGVGTGGQVVVPMLYKMCLRSFAFEMGQSIVIAVQDGASIINLSTAYPCRLFLNNGPEIEYCSVGGRATLCAAIGAAIEGGASLACLIFPPSCLLVGSASSTVVAACNSTLPLLGDVRSFMQIGIDYARSQGVPVVVCAGNALGSAGVGGIDFCQAVRCGEMDVSDLGMVPSTLSGVICVGAASASAPYQNTQLYGNRVDIWAPEGVPYFSPSAEDDQGGLPSQLPNPPHIGQFAHVANHAFRGTSASTPYITGIIAMMQAVNPELNPRTPGLSAAQVASISDRIRNLLVNTAHTPANNSTLSVDGKRRNLVNAIAAVRAAATGHLPDFSARGYDASLGYNEGLNPPSDERCTGTIVNATVDTTFTDTILSIPGAGNFTDADWYQLVTPSTPGLYCGGRIRLTYPIGARFGALLVNDQLGTLVGQPNADEEIREFKIPPMLESAASYIRVSAYPLKKNLTDPCGIWAPIIGGDASIDNVYKIEFLPAKWCGATPTPDVFDRGGNPAGPNNNAPVWAVPLGSSAFPWNEAPTSEFAPCAQRIVINQLNFHRADDVDWFIVDVPAFPPSCGTCRPSLMIETAAGVRAVAYDASMKILRASDTSVLDVTAPDSGPIYISLSAANPGEYVEYNLRVTAYELSAFACDAQKLILHGSMVFRFPVRINAIGDPPLENPGDFRTDAAGRILDPVSYVINWRGGDLFQLQGAVPAGNSLLLQLMTPDNQVLAMAGTSDLQPLGLGFGTFGVQSTSPSGGNMTGVPADAVNGSGNVTVLLQVTNLPPGFYLLAVSHARFDTPVSLLLPQGATRDNSRTYESTHQMGIVPGDLDKDGALTQADITRLNEFMEGIRTPTQDDLLAADANGNGYLDSDDKSRLVRALNGELDLYVDWPRVIDREMLSPDSPETDSDGDGIPDWWELFHGTNPNSYIDGAQDLDGDGQSNFGEYVSGTNPEDRNSSLKAYISRTPDGIVHLRFTAVYGRSYTLEYRNALDKSNAWQPLYQIPAVAYTQTIELTDPTGGSQRFYRVATR